MDILSNLWQSMSDGTVTFIGIGLSHIELIKSAVKSGLKVSARDKNTLADLGQIGEELTAIGVELILGEGYLDNLKEDVIFRTPGFTYYHPALTEAINSGSRVTSEMEEFFKLAPCKIFAITGSDGKTTTSHIVSALMEEQGYNIHLGGNLGRPLLPVIDEISPEDIAVIELSSFQLMSMNSSPNIALITNLSPNHLDVHKDMEEYLLSKENIHLHQGATDTLVLNLDDTITKTRNIIPKGKLRQFSCCEKVLEGAYLDNGVLTLVKDNKEIPVIHRDKIQLKGSHNVANFLAAMAVTMDYVEEKAMEVVATTFTGVEHRLEPVRELRGVRYYNDSIATSPTRTIAGIESFNESMIIIAGGKDKNVPYDSLAEKFIQKVRLVILTGDSSVAIEQAIRTHKDYKENKPVIINAIDMAEAVAKAEENACEGEVVILSPACSSFDRYKNFAVRGRDYKKLVMELK